MKSSTILLVEDNQDDADLTIRALRQNNIGNPIEHARDGAEALDYLNGEGAYADRDPMDVPHLVMLDINMPRVGGIEVLRQIRSNPTTTNLPVVIMTTSREDQDLVDAYKNRVNSYVRKPVDFLEFAEAIRVMGLYWLVMNEPPPAPGGVT